jgi:hypothetical protein
MNQVGEFDDVDQVLGGSALIWSTSSVRPSRLRALMVGHLDGPTGLRVQAVNHYHFSTKG